MEYEDLTQLVLAVLIANESPLSVEEIYSVIVTENLNDQISQQSASNDVKAAIAHFLLSAVSTHPELFTELPNEKFVYTPANDLGEITTEAILTVFFENQAIPPGLENDLTNGSPLFELVNINSETMPELIQSQDARVRYVGVFTMLAEESLKYKRDEILLLGLNDTNIKIRVAAIKSIRHPSSPEILNKLIELMEDDILYGKAQQACRYINDTVVYDKFAALTQSPKIDKARFPCFYIQKYGYGVGVRGQFKVLENWDFCKDNFSELGFSEDEVEENIMDSIRYHWRLPRFAREYLMDMCGSSNGIVQNQALKCLDERWAKKDLKILEALNTEGNPRAQSLQLKNIAQLNGQKSISLALNLLDDPVVCDTAVEVLGEHGSKSELETLMEITSDAIKRDQYDLKILAQAINKLKKKLK